MRKINVDGSRVELPPSKPIPEMSTAELVEEMRLRRQGPGTCCGQPDPARDD